VNILAIDQGTSATKAQAAERISVFRSALDLTLARR
jgi:hypothetical protein